MEVPEVRTLASDERDRAIAVQTMAFSSDPMMRWLYPEAGDYLEHFPAFAAAFGGRAFANDTAFVADDFGGAAFWLPVGVEPDGEAIAEVIQRSIGAERFAESVPMLEQMEHFHAKELHWYLPMIGVDPAHQGRGLGSALLRHALARCDAEGVAAYLESSNVANVPLYQRHGFDVIGEIQAGDSPVMVPMLRPARKA